MYDPGLCDVFITPVLTTKQILVIISNTQRYPVSKLHASKLSCKLSSFSLPTSQIFQPILIHTFCNHIEVCYIS